MRIELQDCRHAGGRRYKRILIHVGSRHYYFRADLKNMRVIMKRVQMGTIKP